MPTGQAGETPYRFSPQGSAADVRHLRLLWLYTVNSAVSGGDSGPVAGDIAAPNANDDDADQLAAVEVLLELLELDANDANDANDELASTLALLELIELHAGANKVSTVTHLELAFEHGTMSATVQGRLFSIASQSAATVTSWSVVASGNTSADLAVETLKPIVKCPRLLDIKLHLPNVDRRPMSRSKMSG